jgi:uncharacterized protein
MVIDTHTHMFTLSMMGKGYSKEVMIGGFKHAVDYADIGPTDEFWDQMWEGWKNLQPDQLGEIFVNAKTAAGIDKAVIFTVDIAYADAEMSYQEQNKWFADLARKHPDKLIAFASVDPNRGEEGLKFFEKCIREYGMKGLKLHPVTGQYYPNDKKCYPYYAKAAELGVPILFHTGPGGPQKSSYGNPMLIDDVAADFPTLNVILAHIAEPWMQESIAMVNWRKNVYLDISGGQLLYRFDPEGLVRLLKQILRMPARSRTLFATDTFSPQGWFLPDKEWIEVVRGLPESKYAPEIPVSKQAVDDLLGGNARRLLGL